MDLQLLFECYEDYWWAAFIAYIAAIYLQRSMQPVYETDTGDYRWLTTKEILRWIWYDRDEVIFGLTLMAIVLGALLYLAPYFTDVII